MVMGIDALVLPLVRRFIHEGVLPNFRLFLENGSVSEALSVLPPYTPTNWATIATGAVPGKHGAGNWTDVTLQDSRDRIPLSTFDARTIEAEPIWRTLSQEGLKSLVITYPGSFPASVKGCSIVAPLYRGLTGHVLARGGSYKLDLKDGGFADLSLHSAKPTGPLIVPTEDGHRVLDEIDENLPRFTVLREGEGLAISGTKEPLKVKKGEWSSWGEVSWPDGRLGSVRFKWLADGEMITLVRSEIYPTTAFTDPPELSHELYRAAGPFVEHPAQVEKNNDQAMEAVLEEIQDQVDWYAQVIDYMAESHPWDFTLFHWHWIDTAQHTFLAALDPEEGVAPDKRAVDFIRRSYQLADRLLGRLLATVSRDDYLVIVSDHGHVPNRRIASVARRLVESGLAQFDPEKFPRQILDRNHSLVYVLSPHELAVNLRGRNDGGIVAPEDYNQVLHRALDALLDWKDPKTHQRPVAYALAQEHQGLFGYFGKRTGDIMFLYNPGYSWGIPKNPESVGDADGTANHGAQLPTTRTQMTSNLATIAAMGPKIRKQYQRDADVDGYLSLTDVAPLIAHLLGIHPPKHARGAVPWDFFEG